MSLKKLPIAAVAVSLIAIGCSQQQNPRPMSPATPNATDTPTPGPSSTSPPGSPDTPNTTPNTPPPSQRPTPDSQR
jgi:hypothetical protein